MLALLFSVMFPALVSAGPSDGSDLRVWLESSVERDRLIVVPFVEAGRDGLIEYALTGRKTGKSGRSNTRQSGSVSVHKGKVQSLSRLVFNIGQDDKIDVDIQLKEDGRIIYEQSLSYP